MLYIKKGVKIQDEFYPEFPFPSIIESVISRRDADDIKIIIRDIKLIISDSVPIDEDGYPFYNEHNSDTKINTTYPVSNPPRLFVELSDITGFTYLYCYTTCCSVEYSNRERKITEHYTSKEILFVFEQWLVFLEIGLLIEPPLDTDNAENINELLAFWEVQPDYDMRKTRKIAHYAQLREG